MTRQDGLGTLCRKLRRSGSQHALIVVPILMASLDLVENGCIAVILWMWPDLSHGLVEASSLATQVKFMARVLTEVLMGVLAAVWLVRWGIRRRAAVEIRPAILPRKKGRRTEFAVS